MPETPVLTPGAARIRAAFTAPDRPLFMPYVMGGYPSLAASADLVRALAPYADMIELGIPFSDPLADGATIQAAGQRALESGVRPEQVIDLAAGLRDGPPVVLMTYVNVILAMGTSVFMERAAAAGVAGVIVPDVPVDEGDSLRETARAAGIAIVPLAAPTTSDERLRAIGQAAEGFLYCVSVAGVTGGEVAVGEVLRDFLARSRAAVDVPLAVGFGIRTAEQVAAVGRLADGVIVASELIRRIDAAPDHAQAMAAAVDFARAARGALEALGSRAADT